MKPQKYFPVLKPQASGFTMSNTKKLSEFSLEKKIIYRFPRKNESRQKKTSQNPSPYPQKMPARAQYLAYSGRPSQKLSIVPPKVNGFQKSSPGTPGGGGTALVAYNSVRWRKWALWIHWSTKVQNPVDETISARWLKTDPSSSVIVGGHLYIISGHVWDPHSLKEKMFEKQTWPVSRPWLDAFPPFVPIVFFSPVWNVFRICTLKKPNGKLQISVRNPCQGTNQSSQYSPKSNRLNNLKTHPLFKRKILFQKSIFGFLIWVFEGVSLSFLCFGFHFWGS